MGLDVSKLTPSPSTLNEGKTKLTMSYYGVVDAEDDNPVSLKLFIDPMLPAYLIENGKREKSIKKKETFSATAPASYTWETEIEITETPASPMVCSLRLEATDAHGYKSSTNSFFIYH